MCGRVHAQRLLRGAGAELHYIYIPCSPIHGNSIYWAPISKGLAVGNYLRAHLSDRVIPRICTATPIGKMDWHTSGWAVEPVAGNDNFMWIRSPYTPDYFKRFAPLANELDNIRVNAEGTIDIQYMAQIGDESLFLGSRPKRPDDRPGTAQSTDAVLEEILAEEQAPEVKALLGALPGGPQQIRLVLEPRDYLIRRFSLPRAARGNLAEAVGYQLPQLTPFSADQLLYACGEADDSPTSGALSVWLVAVPRHRVERALALIDQSPPENPLRLRTPPAPGEPLSLTWRASAPSPTAQRSMRLAWVALVALWIGVVGIHLYKQEQQQRMLDETLADLRTKAVAVSRLHDRLSTVQRRLAQLSELKATGTSPLMVLDGLSQLLDDDTWLQNLELKGRELSIQGLSPSPAGLIERLDDAALLNDVQFEAAITQDVRTGGSRFSIGARVQPQVREDGS